MTGPAFIGLRDLSPREVIARTSPRWDIVERVDAEQLTCHRCQFNDTWEEWVGDRAHGGLVERRECLLLKWHNGHASECLAYDVFLEDEADRALWEDGDPGDEQQGDY